MILTTKQLADFIRRFRKIPINPQKTVTKNPVTYIAIRGGTKDMPAVSDQEPSRFNVYRFTKEMGEKTNGHLQPEGTQASSKQRFDSKVVGGNSQCRRNR